MGAMDYSPHGRFTIASGGTLRVQDGEGTLLYVWHGSVWVTQERDRRDHLLQGGESFRIDRPGKTLITPLGESAVISLTPAARKRAPAFSIPAFAIR